MYNLQSRAQNLSLITRPVYLTPSPGWCKGGQAPIQGSSHRRSTPMFQVVAVEGASCVDVLKGSIFMCGCRWVQIKETLLNVNPPNGPLAYTVGSLDFAESVLFESESCQHCLVLRREVCERVERDARD